MRQVFSFVDTHVLAAEEPPVLMILIFFGQLFLAGARVIPGIGWGTELGQHLAGTGLISCNSWGHVYIIIMFYYILQQLCMFL